MRETIRDACHGQELEGRAAVEHGQALAVHACGQLPTFIGSTGPHMWGVVRQTTDCWVRSGDWRNDGNPLVVRDVVEGKALRVDHPQREEKGVEQDSERCDAPRR